MIRIPAAIKRELAGGNICQARLACQIIYWQTDIGQELGRELIDGD